MAWISILKNIITQTLRDINRVSPLRSVILCFSSLMYCSGPFRRWLSPCFWLELETDTQPERRNSFDKAWMFSLLIWALFLAAIGYITWVSWAFLPERWLVSFRGINLKFTQVFTLHLWNAIFTVCSEIRLRTTLPQDICEWFRVNTQR